LKITSKSQYYELASRGIFGNKFRTWNTIEEYQNSGFTGPTRFRSKVPGSAFFTTAPPFYGDVVRRAYEKLISRGARSGDLIFCEAAPEEFLTFQGELTRDWAGRLQLSWSTEPGITNREAMTRARRSSGLEGALMLGHYLDPGDHDDLMQMLDDYPDHVVEFSVYSKAAGILDRRMIVWEVRLF
jgi:hypothetical protein